MSSIIGWDSICDSARRRDFCSFKCTAIGPREKNVRTKRKRSHTDVLLVCYDLLSQPLSSLGIPYYCIATKTEGETPLQQKSQLLTTNQPETIRRRQQQQRRTTMTTTNDDDNDERRTTNDERRTTHRCGGTWINGIV